MQKEVIKSLIDTGVNKDKIESILKNEEMVKKIHDQIKPKKKDT